MLVVWIIKWMNYYIMYEFEIWDIRLKYGSFSCCNTPCLLFTVSRVSKKISFKDDMECIAILRDSWMIHDTFWRKQISRTSYFGMKSDANKDASVMKCITLKLFRWRIFVFSWEFIRFLCIGQLFICTLNNKNFT